MEPQPEISPESPLEAPRSVWTPLGSQEPPRQRTGQIRGRSRNAAAPTLSGHNNRAGHRLYVKVNQGRAFRRSVLGWGSWKRHDGGEGADHGHHAAARASTNPAARPEPRFVRRALWLEEYRRQRKARLRVGWRKP